MSGVFFSENFKRQEWLRFLKSQPPEYRVRCLQAVLRVDGKQMLAKCLHELGWAQSLDLISEVETNERTT